MKNDGSFETGRVGKQLVLLIDDEEMIRDVGRQVLGMLGYRVITAAGGKQAIEIFSRRKEEIDLVILDLSMPDMDGEATFEALWEIAPGTKVILSSGFSLDSKARALLEKGCCAFMQKPFKISILKSTIEKVLGR